MIPRQVRGPGLKTMFLTRQLCYVLALIVFGADFANAESTIVPEVVQIPAGPFIAGSDRAERESAYRLDEAAYGHNVTRDQGWYEHERNRSVVTSNAYAITRTPITNAQYASFIAATGHPVPDVDPGTWADYGLIHAYEATRRFAWTEEAPPKDREMHPVVLVSISDAWAYAEWLSGATRGRWRLPSEDEWEKAARGTDGVRFPWGDLFDADRLNSHDRGPFDTLPVGSYPDGASVFGLMDAAGQIFEWTGRETSAGRYIVKGGSWDDKGCGVCRPAARHSRPGHLKHILIGFPVGSGMSGGLKQCRPEPIHGRHGRLATWSIRCQ